jgi:hypothetical protein
MGLGKRSFILFGVCGNWQAAPTVAKEGGQFSCLGGGLELSKELKTHFLQLRRSEARGSRLADKQQQSRVARLLAHGNYWT